MPDRTDLDRLQAALEAAGLSPRRQEPMSRRGYWRIGGPADLYVEVEDLAGLRALMRAAGGAPVTVVGNGSNLLVADQGVRGVVVKLTGAFRDSTTGRDDQGAFVEAGGGLLNTVLLRRLDKADLGGLGALAGVPGTVGGAVRMNAGTHLGEVGERVRRVEVVLPGGAVSTLTPRELGFSYRWAALPPGAIITRVTLSLLDDPDAVAREREAVRAHLDRRKATQPLDAPSCGSVFKNPPGDHAGRLVEAAGLKGARQGGAQISDKHANFIVNTGEATAADVYALVRRARDTVWERFGVLLEPEVHAIGAWPPGAWPLPDPQA